MRIQPKTAMTMAQHGWQLLIFLGVLYLALCLFACSFSDSMLFPRPPSSYGEDFPTTYLKTTTGERIACLHLPNDKATVTILFSHGNAEDLGHARDYLEVLRKLGFAVFAYDYPGYGHSSGSPDEEGCHQACEAAYEHLVNELNVPPGRIVLFARSLGGGPTLRLAAEREVGGVILESCFVSAFRVVTRIPFLPGDKFHNLERMPEVTAPKLFIHGQMDGVVAPWHGETLFEAASEPKTFHRIEDAGHNNMSSVGGTAYWEAIRRFCQGIADSAKE